MNFALKSCDLDDAEVIEAVAAGLNQHSAAHGIAFVKQPITLSLQDSQGTVVAGLNGASLGGWMYVRLLWVSETHRGQSLGAKLMGTLENAAHGRACVGIYLDTFAFQARTFYEAQGYAVFGTLGPFFGQHERFFMRKML
jgi:GNAT superfamily N-acetyltransferase